jgi:hypothetical protein
MHRWSSSLERWKLTISDRERPAVAEPSVFADVWSLRVVQRCAEMFEAGGSPRARFTTAAGPPFPGT